jgi:hypothetical protein
MKLMGLILKPKTTNKLKTVEIRPKKTGPKKTGPNGIFVESGEKIPYPGAAFK